MKKVITTLFLINLISILSFSQNAYIPLLEEGAQVNLETQIGMGSSTSCYSKILCDTIHKDGYVYHKVEAGGVIDSYCPESVFIREDTTTQKIFALTDITEDEYLLLDFQLAIGDTFTFGEITSIVDTVYYEEISNQIRKVIVLEEWQKFIEGIGSFTDGAAIPNGWYWRYFTNYEINSCWASNNSNLTDSLDFKLYPNPSTSGQFIIEDLLSGSKEIQIFDANAKLLYQKMVTSSSVEFSLENLNTGFHFLKITGDDYVSIKRFINN